MGNPEPGKIWSRGTPQFWSSLRRDWRRPGGHAARAAVAVTAAPGLGWTDGLLLGGRGSRPRRACLPRQPTGLGRRWWRSRRWTSSGSNTKPPNPEPRRRAVKHQKQGTRTRGHGLVSYAVDALRWAMCATGRLCGRVWAMVGDTCRGQSNHLEPCRVLPAPDFSSSLWVGNARQYAAMRGNTRPQAMQRRAWSVARGGVTVVRH